MTDPKLFTPYTLGALTLSNRVVLAPLTRNRAGHGFVPSEFAALRQRFKNTYIGNNGYDLDLATARRATSTTRRRLNRALPHAEQSLIAFSVSPILKER